MEYKHTIELGNDNIIHIRIVGDSDVHIASHFVEEMKKLLNSYPKNRYNVLVQMESAGSADVEAIRKYADIMNNNQLHKVAFIETPAIPKIFAELVAKFAQKDLVQFFDGREDAIKWLNA